ncbi:hypothetical protein AB0J57_07175 [Streptomyces sp. NPDC049837]|uniref:hypothetical protein n=1 Tax=Streptomyces sp. NPDC049837 TaxID=3155277 RepID=UPI0034437830
MRDGGDARGARSWIGRLRKPRDIADRPVTGPLRGDPMDGRYQLLTVLDQWAKERGVPAQRATAMRQRMDDGYVRALWLRV